MLRLVLIVVTLGMVAPSSDGPEIAAFTRSSRLRNFRIYVQAHMLSLL